MKQHVVRFAWVLSIVATGLAVLTWAQHVGGSISHLSVYQIFPVFGLIAFGLMWTHYIVGALRTYYGIDKEKLSLYMRTTFVVVLVALLMHPGLLTWQLWRDHFGLPIDYVAPDMRLYVILGEVAWITFLLFELHRFYKERTWWHWIERASDVAMILILIHAYKLGPSLLPGWFRLVWIFYGLTLIAAISYLTYTRHKTTQKWL
jgi:hypothetical protein